MVGIFGCCFGLLHCGCVVVLFWLSWIYQRLQPAYWPNAQHTGGPAPPGLSDEAREQPASHSSHTSHTKCSSTLFWLNAQRLEGPAPPGLSDEEREARDEAREKFRIVRTVLEQGGHFSGINRKVGCRGFWGVVFGGPSDVWGREHLIQGSGVNVV